MGEFSWPTGVLLAPCWHILLHKESSHTCLVLDGKLFEQCPIPQSSQWALVQQDGINDYMPK